MIGANEEWYSKHISRYCMFFFMFLFMILSLNHAEQSNIYQ